MNKFTYTINFGNSPNKNNRVYPKKVVQQISEKINKNPNSIHLYIGTPNGGDLKSLNIIGSIQNASYEETYNSINITSTICNPSLLETEFDKYFSIVPNGTGTLENNIVNEDYELNSFSIVPKQDSAFNI